MVDDASSAPEARIVEILRASPVFGRMTDEGLDALASAMELHSLSADDVLFEHGAPADAMHVVLSGELEAYRGEGDERLSLSKMGTGTTVGEIQLLTSGMRTASVCATRPTDLGRLGRDAAYELADRYPELLASIADVIRERLRRDQLVAILPRLFGSADEETLREVESRIEWLHVPRGTRLYRRGDPGTHVHLIAAGRLRAIDEDSRAFIREYGEGELVGERAVFSGQAYGQTLYAARDCELARLDIEGFERLVSKHPRFLRAITSMLVQRRDRRRRAEQAAAESLNVALIPLADDLPSAEFAERLVKELEPHGKTIHISSAGVDEHLQMEGVAQMPEDSPHSIRVRAIFGLFETTHDYMVFEADPGDTQWTRRCIRQADRVLLIGRHDGDPSKQPVEKRLAAESAETAAPEQLVLLHPNGDTPPRGTARWLSERPLELHHHVRWDRDEDIARIARFLRGRAVGLVLGGGGARGMAHIGALRALTEAGVPIDFVGGTSAGGGLATQIAAGRDAESMRVLNGEAFLKHKPFRGFSIPIVSLVGQRRMKEMALEIAGDQRLEDLWLNCFTVACSLSDGATIVQRTGPVWKAVLATSALPGIAVPVVDDDGGLLVDGGVVDNLPGTIMKRLCRGPTILVDVSPEERFDVAHDEIPAAGSILWSWVAPHRESIKVPKLTDVIVRTAVVSSLSRREEAERIASLLLRPPIAEFGLVEFHSFERIIDAGYVHAKEAIEQWPDRDDVIAGRVPASD